MYTSPFLVGNTRPCNCVIFPLFCLCAACCVSWLHSVTSVYSTNDDIPANMMILVRMWRKT